MVLLQPAIVFSLQALGALAVTIPGIQDITSSVARDTDVAANLQIPPEVIFGSNTIKEFDPALFVLRNESIFASSDDDSIDIKYDKRAMTKRFPVDNWSLVDVRACWSIQGVNDVSAYYINFENLQQLLWNNGRASVTLGPNQYWEYVQGNVRIVVRNQNACQTRVAFSDEISRNMEALWYRCSNEASGWTLYTWEDISGTAVALLDFVVFVQPSNFEIPPYSRTSC